MRLGSPENFSENGARPVQFLGPRGRLIGWARSFSDTMTVTDNTIMGDRPAWRLTRIAGRDVSAPDGHTVGKTFSRKAPWKTGGSRTRPAVRLLPTALRQPQRTRTKVLTRPRRGGIPSLAYKTGRGRLASATGYPVSFVPIHYSPTSPLQAPDSSLKPASHHAQNKLNKIKESS
jgi:hypothetical protein